MAEVLVWILEAVFVVGWIGCAITIPVAAWKYGSVLLEKDTPEEIEMAETVPTSDAGGAGKPLARAAAAGASSGAAAQTGLPTRGGGQYPPGS